MPGIHTTEVLQWRPMSELSKHGDSMLLLCAMNSKTPGHKYYTIVPACNANGVLRLTGKEGALRLASEVFDRLCAWAYRPQGYDFEEEKAHPATGLKPRLIPPKLKRR